MSFRRVTVSAMLLAAVAPAWAINKCIGTDGKPVFQDAPCMGKGEKIVVRPASGDAPEPDKAALAAAPVPEGQRLERQLSQVQSERRRRDLEVAIPKSQFEQANFMQACDRDLQALQDKKALARNNLAGATWLQSISTEMGALTRRCESRTNAMTANIEAMRKECQALGGCK